MRATGLNEELDQLIEGLPDDLFRPPDWPLLIGHEELSRDPYPPLRALRERAGAVVRRGTDGTFDGLAFPNTFMHDDALPRFLILGIDAHLEMVRQPDIFRNGDEAYGPGNELVVGRIVTLMDGTEHDEHRALMLQSFGRPAVKRLHDELVEPIAAWLVDRVERRLKDGQDTCFYRDVGLPMAYKVMTGLLGIAQEKFASFVDLGGKLFNTAADFEAGMQAGVELWDLWSEELKRRRAEPADDLLTWLAHADFDGNALTDDDIVTHARFFLPAGIETTARSIGLMGLALLGDRARFEAVCADPSLIEAAVEESNRWLPSGFVVPRRAAEDAVLAGVAIPAGSALISLQGIVNRDDARWPDPDEFDLHREQRPHMTFNAGVHMCLGMHVAKLEMQAVLRATVERLPTLRLACPPEDVVVEGLTIRSPQRVPLAL
jgi:cytochrome P450